LAEGGKQAAHSRQEKASHEPLGGGFMPGDGRKKGEGKKGGVNSFLAGVSFYQRRVLGGVEDARKKTLRGLGGWKIEGFFTRGGARLKGECGPGTIR